ncbi:hypothetical protein BJY04DRAFT_217746 [Aspergillus karnatakaensis]|uniref:Zn(II)2Cys6 transcription factor n=1 Tax=Aspergillus karnatakaensis TaxID=1810916 RepID=UPI003CCD0471
MKRVVETNRSSSAYPRKRAVTACQVCRARRTKCDQKKPRCSFCEQSGAECISDPAAPSSFDPASLAILERLGVLEQKLDSMQLPAGSRNAQDPITPSPVSQSTITLLPSTASLLPGNLETVLAWPALQRSVSHLLQTPGPKARQPLPPNPILGDELNPSSTQEYLDSFFKYVHIKNPVLDATHSRNLVQRVSLTGPAWDAESCLALLICANGAIIRPFSSASLSSQEPQISTGQALFNAAQRRMGIVLDSAGLVEAQCLFFAGVYLMSILRPYDAWRSFLQGLAICQTFRSINSSTTQSEYSGNRNTAEESIYWSCWKSECELRFELGLPDFGSSSGPALTAPQRFPSLPSTPTHDDQVLRAWYFYLAEISLWRLEMGAMKDLAACLGKMQQGKNEQERLLDLLCGVSEIYTQQSVAWQDSLPSMVSISESTCGGTGTETDSLRFILRGRKTYVDELITWPFIVLALGQSEFNPRARAWLSKGVAAHLERLEINSPGFYHRHHGTWLMIRSSARSICILIAIARTFGADSFPVKWRGTVEKSIEMLVFWSGEVDGLEEVADLCRGHLAGD